MPNSRNIVWNTIRFEGAPRLPRDLPEPHGSDFAHAGMTPNVDARPPSGRDEWGSVWSNIGVTSLGEVTEPAIPTWSQFAALTVPEIKDPIRWQSLAGARDRAGDRFLLTSGVSLYERAHFLRGLSNLWMDIHEAEEELSRLLDILVEMNLYAIERYAQAGADGLIFCDDWGLQNRLMISPDSWRHLWKPRYARVYDAAHQAGMATFLHSCGHIVDILDDLIDAGLDVIQMDQQMNMGLETLGERFGGRITFWCPVDIQTVMPRNDEDEIRNYVTRMVRALGRPEGGFIAKWYSDPKSVGHTPEAIEAMCQAFMDLSPADAR
ncbi:hypothetical protein HQ520_03400 [bacterium]|nr:hypothetical protein [bacterium]